jgi:urea ABC transporter permease protein UrtC
MSYSTIKTQVARSTTKEKAVVVLIAVLAIVPLGAERYISFLSAQFLLFGLLALSLGLIWGYGGILSFGHAAFFGLGAYSMAWSYKYFSFIFNPGYVGLIGATLIPATLAILLGLFLFYSKVRDVYFVIITLAVSVILQQLATSSGIMFEIFGGFNGLFVPRMPLSIPGVFQLNFNDRLFYILTVLVTVVVYLLCRWLVQSHFGEVLIAIREDEERTQALGYNTAYYKTLVFGFSAAIAGLAGALYASLAGFVDPSLLGFVLSTEVVIWVAVGGRQFLVGAILGAVLVNAASSGLSQVLATRDTLILGVLFIVVVVFFKRGIAGPFVDWIRGEETQ